MQLSSILNAGLPAITVGTCSKVAVTGTTAQSSAVTATVVRLVATNDMHVKFGSNPTAVADGTSMFLPAGVPEYFKFTSGDKIAAIQDAVAGTLYVTAAA